MNIKQQINDAQVAWVAARKAIEEAWKLTPEQLLQTRTPIGHRLRNQTIAYSAADAMIEACSQSLKNISINDYERRNGRSTHTDEEMATP